MPYAEVKNILYSTSHRVILSIYEHIAYKCAQVIGSKATQFSFFFRSPNIDKVCEGNTHNNIKTNKTGNFQPKTHSLII